MNLSATLANSLWNTANLPGYFNFRHALRNPGETQKARLQTYLERNAQTEFGKAHGFESIRNYEEFTQRVPLSDYAAHEPWIERICRGETNILTHDPVTHLVPTSGSTGARKLVPFTSGLQREFNAAIAPWLIDLNHRVPGLSRGQAYWSVTPALRHAPIDESVVPIGFDSDTAYLGGARKKLVDAIMAVPSLVQRAASLETFRYATLLCLLRCRDLRLISVWHPSFLSLLLDALPSHWKNLLFDIEKGACRFADAFPAETQSCLPKIPQPRRAKELLAANPLEPETLWPELRVISCWGDGAATLAVADLRRRFPNILLQSKGIIATEAFVTLPFRTHQPLAITSHYFEFIDSAERVHLPENLLQGEEYEVVVTTAGGLWRYRLGDRVIVNGWVEKTPSLRFLGRNGNVSDGFGEKLSETFVAQVMRETFGEHAIPPKFALLAPDEDAIGCRYTLYVEGSPQTGWAESFERALRRNPHYDYCRDLGQLLPLRVFVITSKGYETFARRLAAQGARFGEIKPTVLSRLPGWSEFFPGNYLEPSEIFE